MKWRPKFSELNFVGKILRDVDLKCNNVLLLITDCTLKYIITFMRSEVLVLINI